LHAFTGNADSWEHQIPAFTAAGYRCITYDRRGWGRSETDPAGPQPGYATDDLHGLVDHLGIDRFHFIGTAGGGYVTLDYALTHPERLRSAVVACSGGGLQADPEYTALGSKYGRTPEFGSLPAWFREIGPTYRVENPEGVERWIKNEENSRQQQGFEQHMRQEKTLKLLETMKVPTLMLAGDCDLLASPPRMRAMAARIPSCEFALVPEAGHSAYWEQPEIWNRIVLDFIKKH
jgi:pimeloyl-ACP methyl ester carboxylesterase